jgi:SHS2 domain-containing protein
MKNFEYLKHTADAEFIAYGNTTGETFENAALALTNLMLDPKTIAPEIEKEVDLSGEALDMLLFDWLSELLYIFEVDRLVFGKFKIEISGETGAYTLKAKAFGEGVNKHPDIFLHIKAVTFHDLRFEKRNNIYEAQVLLDI